MARKCKACGARLSERNLALLCWPCQEKRKNTIQEEIDDTPNYTVSNLCMILGYKNPESVKRLGREGKIPGRVPGIRVHLYQKAEVDAWLNKSNPQKQTNELGEKEKYYP